MISGEIPKKRLKDRKVKILRDEWSNHGKKVASGTTGIILGPKAGGFSVLIGECEYCGSEITINCIPGKYLELVDE